MKNWYSPAREDAAEDQLNLIAQQATLNDQQQTQVAERNDEILNSQDTRERIAALLASLQRRAAE